MGGISCVNSSLNPDVLLDFHIQQRSLSSEEWTMKGTDAEAAHDSHIPRHLLHIFQGKYSHLLHETTVKDGPWMLFSQSLRPPVPLLQRTYGFILPPTRV